MDMTLELLGTILDLGHLIFWGTQEKYFYYAHLGMVFILFSQLTTALHVSQNLEARLGPSLEDECQGTMWKV